MRINYSFLTGAFLGPERRPLITKKAQYCCIKVKTVAAANVAPSAAWEEISSLVEIIIAMMRLKSIILGSHMITRAVRNESPNAILILEYAPGYFWIKDLSFLNAFIIERGGRTYLNQSKEKRDVISEPIGAKDRSTWYNNHSNMMKHHNSCFFNKEKAHQECP